MLVARCELFLSIDLRGDCARQVRWQDEVDCTGSQMDREEHMTGVPARQQPFECVFDELFNGGSGDAVQFTVAFASSLY